MNKIAFRVDGNETIGLGHLSRCMTIAQFFVAKRVDVYFIVSSDTNTNVIPNAFNVIVLKNTLHNRWDKGDFVDVVSERCFDSVLIDSYFVDSSIVESVGSHTSVFYIDDNYKIDFKTTGIINYNIESSPVRYNEKKTKRLFLGTKYFPLNQKFLMADGKNVHPDYVLITTGSTDRLRICLNVVNHLSKAFPNEHYLVLKGAFFETNYIKELEEFEASSRNVSLLDWGDSFFGQLKECKLVIGPGSTILYESLCLNVPCISFEFVENHHLECVSLDSLDLVPFVGEYNDSNLFSTKLCDIFMREIKQESLQRRKKRIKSFFDTKGTERIYEAIKDNYENNH